MDNKVETAVKEEQNIEMILEYRTMKKYLRLRGVEEQRDESISQKATEILADFLEEQADEIEYNFEPIYRVNSEYAQKKNLATDVARYVVIRLLTKKMKEDILRKQSKEPLEINGKRILIMKELPSSILQGNIKGNIKK